MSPPRRLLVVEAVAQTFVAHPGSRSPWQRRGGGPAVSGGAATDRGASGDHSGDLVAVDLGEVVAIISSRNSVRTFVLPRRWERANPLLCLVSPKSGSTVCSRLAYRSRPCSEARTARIHLARPPFSHRLGVARLPLSGATQHRDVGHHLVHVLLIPIAGIRGDRFGELPDPRPCALSEGGGDHRVKLREVCRRIGDLRREHDLLLVSRPFGRCSPARTRTRPVSASNQGL
jgi:hypothetical protein